MAHAGPHRTEGQQGQPYRNRGETTRQDGKPPPVQLPPRNGRIQQEDHEDCYAHSHNGMRPA